MYAATSSMASAGAKEEEDASLRGRLDAGPFAAYDQRGPHGCNELYNASSGLKLRTSGKPSGKAVATMNHPFGGVTFVSADWTGRSQHPHGLPVLCPRSCFYQFDKHMSSQEAENVRKYGGRCPW